MEPYYEDDAVQIYHGDCREIQPMWRDPAFSFGAMVTDPPYGIDYASHRMGKFKGQRIANDTDVAMRDGVLAEWPSAAAVFGSWKREKPKGTRAVLIWDKGEGVGMGDLSLPWRPNTEEIYIIGDGWSGHRGSSVIRDTSVVSWTGNGSGPRRSHPNEKPVSLLRQIISKAPAGTILDPFMGSGSTLRAAKDLGRKAIGIEIEERYCEVAARRMGQEVLDLFG
jgi:DNA modification methylase